MSKAALTMAAKLFATRLAPHNIPVFEIEPGIIRTDMIASGGRELRSAHCRWLASPATHGRTKGCGECCARDCGRAFGLLHGPDSACRRRVSPAHSLEA